MQNAMAGRRVAGFLTSRPSGLHPHRTPQLTGLTSPAAVRAPATTPLPRSCYAHAQLALGGVSTAAAAHNASLPCLTPRGSRPFHHGVRRLYSTDGGSKDPQPSTSHPAPAQSTPSSSDVEKLAASLRFAGSEPPDPRQDAALNKDAGSSPTAEDSEASTPEDYEEPSPDAVRRRWILRTIMLSIAAFGSYQLFWPQEDTAEIEADIKESLPPVRGWKRASFRITSFFKFFRDPVAPSLLPDPLPPPYRRPYTLVINLDDTLVHSHWDPQHGWRHLKRPGVEYFLAYVCQFYEIVVFTKSQFYAAAPIIEQIDPFGYIIYKLYKESTRYVDGKHVKDLSNLNRDLQKVIVMDVSEDAVSYQPENAIILPRWEGDLKDNTLLSYLPFLETLALSGPEDVRAVLKSYGETDIPMAFGANQAAELARQKQSQTRLSLSSLSSPSARVGPEPLEVLQRKHLRFIQDQLEYREKMMEHRKAAEAQQQKEMEEAANRKMSFMEYMVMTITGQPPPGQGLDGKQMSSPS